VINDYALQSFAKRFDYLTIEGNHRLHDLTFIVIRHYRYVRQRNWFQYHN